MRNVEMRDIKFLARVEDFMINETKLDSDDLPHTGKTLEFAEDIIDQVKDDMYKNKDQIVKEFELKLEYARFFDTAFEVDLNPKIIAIELLLLDVLCEEFECEGKSFLKDI